MKPAKSPKQQPVSLHSLAKLFGRTRAFISAALVELEPAGRVRGHPVFDEAAAIVAIEKALEDGPRSFKNDKTIEEIRKLKIANDFKEGVLIRRQSVIESIGRAAAAIDGLLERKLCEEYPSAVAGLDVAQARIYGRRLGDSIRELFMALAKEWRQ